MGAVTGSYNPLPFSVRVVKRGAAFNVASSFTSLPSVLLSNRG